MYNRIRNIIKDPRRKSHLFNNENFSKTFVSKSDTETYQQRQVRGACILLSICVTRVAMAVACLWLSEHLSGSPVHLTVISEDPLLHNYLEEESNSTHLVHVLSMKEFIERNSGRLSTSVKDLFESLLQLTEITNVSQSTKKSDVTHFEEYLPDDILEAGVKSQTYFSGILNVNINNSEEAFIRFDNAETTPIVLNHYGHLKEIFIPDKELRNRAIHGDSVVVELLPQANWKSPAAGVRRMEDQDEEEYRYVISMR